MGKRVTMGGDTLGRGKKQKVELKSYERSTHDLSYVHKTTLSAGTLVPFLCEVALPGDSFDIKLNAKILTHPTIGPLFGSYKAQYDIFEVPIKNYQPQLHNNKLGIGLNMKNIKLPLIELEVKTLDLGENDNMDNEHINPSHLLSHLNIRGLGTRIDAGNNPAITKRRFNAVPYIAYFDIYKNYYANKQEEIGYIVHNDLIEVDNSIVEMQIRTDTDSIQIFENPRPVEPNDSIDTNHTVELVIDLATAEQFDLNRIILKIGVGDYGSGSANAYIEGTPYDFFEKVNWNGNALTLKKGNEKIVNKRLNNQFYFTFNKERENPEEIEPNLRQFNLSEIDDMRENILSRIKEPDAFIINYADMMATTPIYGAPLKYIKNVSNEIEASSLKSNQEGLLIKQYQSDLFNNWLNSEWIAGNNGINELTAMEVVDGKITINEMLVKKKVFAMLNDIAMSGGSYNDWIGAVYDHDGKIDNEIPTYCGGLSKELIFEEVVSNASVTTENGVDPLGTLAGRGRFGEKHKGGNITIRVDEPSYIMGIMSLTPRLDYSQGNGWDVDLETMDDFHKPAMDGIGFQDLITEQMAWWDTRIIGNPEDTNYKVIKNSAGKVPAWLNYMTKTNVVRGNFAEKYQQQYMVLTRRYEAEGGSITIKDLTTYVDPVKFNHIFADTRRDAQNFWSQIAIDMTVRRKMSAKLMPH